MNAQTRELLRWVELEPRAYSEVVEVWRTSCPRLPVWEDALADGLVEVVRVGSRSTAVLTALGSSALAAA